MATVQPIKAEVAPKNIDKAGRRVAKKGEAPKASYLEIAPTPVQVDFAAWLAKETGYPVDERSVSLATALRGEFQRSETNQSRLGKRREEIEQEKAARKEARAAREAARAAKAAEPKPEPKAKAEKPAPAAKAAVAPKPAASKPTAKTAAAAKPTTKATASKTAAAKATTTNRRRPVAAAAGADAEF